MYDAGKRDIATLYEYWIFLQLYDLVVTKFNLESYKTQNFGRLFEEDESGLSLKLKSGKELIIKGSTDFPSRNLSIRFSYNRTFKGGNRYTDRNAGSITTTLCPDYTLSIWPASFTETEAESEEVIVHIHFDAKYKIENITNQYTVSENPEDLDAIEAEERKGTFKNVDVLKMHAYKDAIRRTGGAYILYPGSVEKRFDGFHEVLPGLGAFTINPSLYDTGIAGLSHFLDKVIQHLLNRTSQRERVNNSSGIILREPAVAYKQPLRPLPYAMEREKPDIAQVNVIVGYSRSQKHLEWCESNGIYNFRVDSTTSKLMAQTDFVSARYLLLREAGKDKATLLYSLKSTSHEIWTKEALIQKGYPSEPGRDHYFIIEIEPCKDLEDLSVSFKNFEEYQSLTGSVYEKAGKPFVVTLDKVLRVNSE